MRAVHLLFLSVVLFVPRLASGQDWQDCKPEGDFSFNEVKAAIRRVTATQVYSSWDEKAFNRTGDLVAVVILQTFDDDEMASPKAAKDLLNILRAAFACANRCVKTTDERRPRVTLVLLEHLRELTGGKMNKDIDEAKKFILEQARKAG